MSQWTKKSFATELKKGQRVRAKLCTFKEDHGTEVEGTVTEDTDGMFEVFEIDVNGNPTMVFYPSEVLAE